MDFILFIGMTAFTIFVWRAIAHFDQWVGDKKREKMYGKKED